jgi:bifunctional UDP-N-acetylglucosamine pyrophosphorylase/glucosamine-1-phosphate N-acetyltransferase
MGISVVILAAGQGKRMRSDLPKVLHHLAGRPLLDHVIATALGLNPDAVFVVHGHGGAQVRERLRHHPVTWIEQREQLGTGHAVQQVLPRLNDNDTILVLYGDVPLVRRETLSALLGQAADRRLALLTVELDDPSGYGRIVRDGSGAIRRIVEHKDADADQRAITEINTGILAVPGHLLRRWLARLDNGNAQGEYYLTDIVAMAVADDEEVASARSRSALEVSGVNDKSQLSVVEREYQREQAERLMQEGVTLLDPARFDLRGTLKAGRDVVIDVNAVIVGDVELGDRVHVGANAHLANARIGNDVEILPNCVIEDAVIGEGCRIGPFARIRPETELAAHVHVGNFVEIKKSTVAEGSKINHLSYVGDSSIGQRVNIGAGTITCNYDGANKYRTVIGDDAFIGSNTALVAPVTVAEGATIGAGSTISRDAPPGKLTLTRAKQLTVPGWQRPTKKPSE